MYPLLLRMSLTYRWMRKQLCLRDECIDDVRRSWEGRHKAPPFQRRDIRHQDIGNQINPGVADCVQQFTYRWVQHRSTEPRHAAEYLVEHTGCERTNILCRSNDNEAEDVE